METKESKRPRFETSSEKNERRPVYLPQWDIDLESYYPEGGGRIYKTPEGEFESVTTLLEMYSEQDYSGLERWKKRVGEKKAEAIMKASGRKGTSFHNIAESFLKGEEDYLKGHMPSAIALFKSIEPTLRKIQEVYALEQALFSKTMRMAGRADCVARGSGLNLLVDFKNARTRKKREWIHNYFLQSTAYSLMLKEMFDFNVDNIVIAIANRDGTSDIYVENPRKYIKDNFFWKVFNRGTADERQAR